MSKHLNTWLIVITTTLYLYGYKVAKLFYNADNLIGEERKQVIHDFWQCRLGIYALIIASMFYIAKQKLTRLQNSLTNIGLSLALFSAFDKIILNDYSISQYDKLFVFSVVMIELYKYKKVKSF